ncbi:retrotransposon protein, putative, ty1-copia subclass, partial [Tanacetum coccineum]
IPSNGIYEIDMHDLVPNVNSIYNVSTKRAKHNLDSTYLWHCRLAHISKKHVEMLQQEGLLKSTDDESFDQCVSCLSGKMTRKSFPHRPERATGLLEIIHIDVCGPIRHVSRQESATRILYMVPTKKVDKTPYELWYGKAPNLSYLKVWGCEALVKWDTPNKLQQRSVKCIFIGYPKKTMGYYFYFPPENKIIVARHAEFFEKNLIIQEVNGRAIDLEEIQNEDTSPSKITSEIPIEVEGFELPQEEVILVRRSKRTHRALDHLCLNVEAEEHMDRCDDADKQSMMDNMVWVLVDLPPGCKTVRSKWIFKKKTDMDGIVHTYKARLVAKGYTQLYGVDYEETFSPIADIRAIKDSHIYSGVLLILIIPEKYASFKDPFMVLSKHQEAGIKDLMKKSKGLVLIKIVMSHIWGKQHLFLESKRLIGLGQNAYMDKILKRYKMDNSKRGHIPMQERLDLNKTQGASTPKEVRRMQNVPYVSHPAKAETRGVTSWISSQHNGVNNRESLHA